jgi:hypothetical protein
MRALLFIALLISAGACSNAADPIAIDAPHHVDAPATADAAKQFLDAPPAMLRILVVNEVVAAGAPDWVEVVNATTSPVELSDFLIVDARDDFTKAVPFPAQMLGPGGFATIDCDGVVVPFKLASDEEIWVYRASDHALSDGVDWNDGDSPVNGSFARVPDTFAPFVISAHPTKGAPNQL